MMFHILLFYLILIEFVNYPPLLNASFEGNFEVVKLLLTQKKKKNITDKKQQDEINVLFLIFQIIQMNKKDLVHIHHYQHFYVNQYVLLYSQIVNSMYLIVDSFWASHTIVLFNSINNSFGLLSCVAARISYLN